MYSRGYKLNGKLFLKKEATVINKIENEGVKQKIIDLWPSEPQMTEEQIRDVVKTRFTFDPKFREWCKQNLKIK